jgi:hypothetical protein
MTFTHFRHPEVMLFCLVLTSTFYRISYLYEYSKYSVASLFVCLFLVYLTTPRL